MEVVPSKLIVEDVQELIRNRKGERKFKAKNPVTLDKEVQKNKE